MPADDAEVTALLAGLEPYDSPCGHPAPHPGHLWSRIDGGGRCPGIATTPVSYGEGMVAWLNDGTSWVRRSLPIWAPTAPRHRTTDWPTDSDITARGVRLLVSRAGEFLIVGGQRWTS